MVVASLLVEGNHVVVVCHPEVSQVTNSVAVDSWSLYVLIVHKNNIIIPFQEHHMVPHIQVWLVPDVVQTRVVSRYMEVKGLGSY